MTKKLFVMMMGLLLAGASATAQNELPKAQQPQLQQKQLQKQQPMQKQQLQKQQPMQKQQPQHHCGGCKHHMKSGCSAKPKVNADGIALEIANVFPDVKSLKKEGKRIGVLDAKQNVLGYVVYSKPASDGIKGYAGETPLMVALDQKGNKIIKVVLLENQETPSYVKMVMDAQLLNSWDGMKIKKASKKEVDAVSGATYTSRSIVETFRAAIKDL